MNLGYVIFGSLKYVLFYNQTKPISTNLRRGENKWIGRKNNNLSQYLPL